MADRGSIDLGSSGGSSPADQPARGLEDQERVQVAQNAPENPDDTAVAATQPDQATGTGDLTVEKVDSYNEAAVKQTYEAADDLRVDLGANAQIDAILVFGDDLIIREEDGSLTLIKGGLSNLPTIVFGTVEIPPESLRASLEAAGITVPAAGDDGSGSSGGNFAIDPGAIGDPFAIRDLLPPEAFNRVFADIVDNDEEFIEAINGLPTIGLNNDLIADDDDLTGGIAGGIGDDDPANLTGVLAHDFGQDGAGAISLLATGAPQGFTYAVNEDGSVLTVLQGGVAVLRFTVNPVTGEYVLQQLSAIKHALGQDENNQAFTFTYQVTDSGGDLVVGTFNLSVDDDTPTVGTNATVVIDDDDVASVSGNPGGVGDDAPTIATGVLAHNFGADFDGASIAFLTSGAPAGFTYQLSGANLLIVQGAVTVITVTLDPATGAYTVTQNAPISHPPGSNENNVQFNLSYQVTDGDGDSVNGTLAIDVDDDTPVQVPGEQGPLTVSGLVLEDGMSGQTGDSSEGNKEGSETNADDETSGAAGSLTGLISVGADEPLTISLSTDTSGLPTLFSHGIQLTYAVVGNVLTATAGSTTVFTLTVNNDGSWSFDLQDQLDHVDDGQNDENFALRTSANGSTSVSAIDFSSIIVASDADGDSLDGLAAGTFTIAVQDDVPVQETGGEGGPHISATVLEDGMSLATGDASEGNKESGETNADDETSGAAGSLSVFFSPGADEPLTFSLSSDTSSLPTLFSNGVELVYSVVGNVLTATAGATTVFTLTVNANGSWSFDLKDQLDHVDNGLNDENLDLITSGEGFVSAIDFSSVIVATDADGDSLDGLQAGSFTISVQDDVPTAAEQVSIAVDEDDLTGPKSFGNNDVQAGDDLPTSALPDVSGTLVAAIGADEPADISFAGLHGATVEGTFDNGFTGPVTTKGVALTYFWDAATHTLYATTDGTDATTAAANAAFKIEITDTSTGAFTFTLLDQVDHLPNFRNDFPTDSAFIAEYEGNYEQTPIDPEDNIQLNLAYTVTDADGDSIDGSLSIDIDDDIPTVSGETSTGTVDEDALTPYGIEDGPDDIDAGAGTAGTSATGNVGSVFSVGADEPPTYSLNFDTSSLYAQNLSSGSVSLSYFVSPTATGYTLSAFAGATPVFTFDLDSTTGDWTFTLQAKLDHPTLDGLAGDDTENEIVIDFGGIVQATDADTDTVAAGPGVVQITVDDDTPLAACDTATVEEGGGTAVNLIIVLDVSGSMGNDPGVAGFATRLALAKAALENLINTGNVNAVFLVTFDSTGDFHDSGVNGGWFSPAAAIAEINALSTGSATDYDDALQALTTNYTAPPAGGSQTIAYFLSDGMPNEDDGTGTDGIVGAEITAWQNFLTANGISPAISVGIGNGVVQSNLDPLAFPGTAIIVDNEADLISTIGGTLPGSVTGNVLDNDGSGADHPVTITSITVDGTVYTAADTDDGRLEVTTSIGGTLIFYFTDQPGHEAGDFQYLSPTSGIDVDTLETFTYTITDTDGDGSTAQLKITVTPSAVPSIVIDPDTQQANETGLPPRSGEPAGSGEAADGNPNNNSNTSEAVSGSFTVTSPDGLTKITVTYNNGSNSVDIPIATLVGTVVTTNKGTLTFTGYNVGTGVVSYTYTLGDNQDHSGGAVTDVFSITATDPNNDTSPPVTLTIDIIDDVPVARADTDSIAAGGFGPATGNVLTDAEGDGGEDRQGADGAVVVGVAAGGGGTDLDDTGTLGVTIQGAYGKLTLSGNGSYSYVRDANTPGGVDDVFTYTIKDGDGDLSSTTLTISIGNAGVTITDLTPKAQGGDATVDEDDLLAARAPNESAGSDPSKESTTSAGTFSISAPDGIASLTIGGHTVISAGVFTATSFTTPLGNTLSITAFNAGTGEVSYTYTLLDNENHPTADGENSLFEDFAVVLTDLDTSTVSDILTVNIIDDVPTAVADTNSGTEGGIVTGNVLTDGVDDVFGADGAATTVPAGGVTGVAAGSNTSVPVSGGVGVPIAGSFGVLTLNANGSYSYDGNPNVVTPAGATDTFVYTITDGDGDTSTVTLTISLTDSGLAAANDDAVVNEAALPSGSNSSSTAETVTGTVADNVTGGTGPFSYALVGSGTGTHGTLTFNPNGSYSYTLATAVDGATADNGTNTVNNVETFTYQVTDANGNTTTNTITIDVTDDVPTAVADTNSGTEGGIVTGNVLTDGVDDVFGADGAATTVPAGGVTGVAAGSNTSVPVSGGVGVPIAGSFGVLTLNANGSYSYDGNPNVVTPAGATDTFVYTITDGDGDTSTVTLTISLTDSGLAAANDDAVVNEAALPSGSNSSSTAETVTGTVADNVTGGTGPFSYALVGSGTGTHGTLTFNPNGSYSYTLATAVDGATADNGTNTVNNVETFTYQVTDANGNTTTNTITIDVTDDVPTAVADTNSGTEGGIVTGNVLTDGVDDVFGADGAATTVPAGGVTGVAAGSNTSVPVSGGVGVPIAGSFGVLTLNANGSYSYDGNPNVVTPAGATDTFVYTITDGDGDTSTVTLTISLTDSGLAAANDDAVVNEAALPSGSNSSSTAETVTGTVADNVTGGTGPFSYALVGSGTGTHGTLTFNPNGSYSYTLATAVDGATADNGTNTVNNVETFTYQVTDANGNTTTNTITIDVTDDVPTAVADTNSGTEGGIVTGNVLTDGVDDVFGADGAATTVPAGGVTGVAAGSNTSVPVSGGVGVPIAGSFGVLTLNANGSYSYDGNPNVVTPAGATDTFVYTITDGDGDTSTVTLTISLTDSGLAAANDDAVVNEAALPSGSNSSSTAETVTGTVADNVTGGTGPFSYALVGSGTGTHGTLTFNPNGSYSYTLATAVDGATADNGTNTVNNVETFTYQVTDANGNTTTNTITIDVTDDVPTAVADTNSGTEGGIVTGNVLTDGVDDVFGADGAATTVPAGGVTGVAAGSNTSVPVSGGVGVPIAGSFGVLTLNANGSYSYDGNPNVVTPAGATDTFVYTITDGDGDTSTVTLTISLTDSGLAAANDDAVVNEAALPSGSNSSSTAETVTGTVADNVTGGTGPFSYALVGSGTGTHGTLTFNPNGSYSYTLATAVDGATADNGTNTVNNVETFTYQVTDANGNTTTNTITIDVTDDVPTAVADTNSGTEGGIVTGNVLTDGVDDVFGADGAATTVPAGGVTGVAAGSNTSVPVSGGVGVPIAGSFGVLTLNANGSYSYDGNPNVVTPAGATDTFVYTITDGDGDTSTVTLTISLTDSGLAAANDDAVVNEAALPSGSNSSSTAETVTGTVADNVTGGTGPFSYALVGSGTGTHGTLTFNPNGSYSYTLATAVDGATADNGTNTVNNVETFTYQVTDANGNTTTNTITIDVTDDVPTAVSGPSLDVLESAGATSGTNLLANDVQGADGAVLTEVDLGSGFVAISSGTPLGGGVFSFTTANGTYTFQSNGDWTFDPVVNASTSNTTGNFTYRITDGDGDTSQAVQVVNILNANTPFVQVANFAGTVEEEHLNSAQAVGIEDTTSAAPDIDDDTTGDFNITTTTTNGVLSTLVTGGDGTLTFGFNTIVDGSNATFVGGGNVLSQGQQVIYDLQGSTLWGFVNTGGVATQYDPGTDRAVFRVDLTNTTTGAFTVTLLDNIDHHLVSSADNVETVKAIDLSGKFKVTDSDAPPDTHVFQNIGVNVIDDIPVAQNDSTTVLENNNAKSNVVLIIDKSGSMAEDGDPNTTGVQSRISLLKQAVQNLFATGNVNAVFIVAFDTTAQQLAGPVGGWYTDLNAAFTAINALSAAGSTNYDAAVSTTMTAYTNPPAGGDKTITLFMSDGQPTVDNGTGSLGIDDDDGAGGGEETAWINFLSAQGIDASYAVGFGGLGAADVGFLEPLAWSPGEIHSTYDQDDTSPSGPDLDDAADDPNVMIVTPTSLTAVLAGAVAATAGGNVLTDGPVDDAFGADGGRILSIKINGVTYVWDGGSVIDPDNSPTNISGTQLTDIVTAGGGKLDFNFLTGVWSYEAPINLGQDLPESFDYVIVDKDGDQSTATLSILVENVNAAPNGASNTVTIAEDGTHVFAASEFGFSDPDETPADAFLAVKVTSLPGAGTLFFDADGPGGAAPVAVTLNQFISVADITAGKLFFTPAANANGTGYASFNFAVQDNGGTDDGGIDLDPTPATMTINVSAVNDAPTANITNVSFSATEQTNLNLAANGLSLGSVADIDAGTNVISMTLSVGTGILTVTAGNSGVDSITGSGTSSVTVTGTLAEFNNLLGGIGGAGAGTIVYNANLNAPPANTTLTLLIDDTGDTGSGGALTGNDTATINIAAVNDAPVNVVPASIAVTEDTATKLLTIQTSDPDSGASNVTVTLSIPAASGALSASSIAGVTVGGSSTALTLTGTVAAINAFLSNAAQSVTYTPVGNSTADVTLTVLTNDGGATGTGGALSDSDNVTLDLQAVNDAPTANITNVSFSATEQTNLNLAANGLSLGSVADIDAGTNVISMTLSVGTGILTVAAGNSGVDSITGSGTSSVTVTGTLAEFNNLLGGIGGAGAGTIVYNANLNAPPANTTLTLLIDDTGDTGSGGALTGNDTATINIAAVDDAPIANDDIVRTIVSGSGSTTIVPEWALLFNDTDPDNTLDITATSGINDLTSASLVTNPGSVTVVNNDADGGSFTYTATGGALSDTASVSVVVDTGTMDGNASDNEIFVADNNANTINANGGNDIVFAGGGDDTITGGAGADIMSGETGADGFIVSSGQSPGTVNTAGDGSISGYDIILDFDIASDELTLDGGVAVVADTAGTNGTDSTLLADGATIKSHAVSNGVITFDTNNTYDGTPVVLDSLAEVAAAVEYLHNFDFNNDGTVAFVANIGGTAHTFVFEQVGNSQSLTNDILVDLVGVTITNLTTLVGNGTVAPIVLDLDGDGVEFLAIGAGNGALFDMDGNGTLEQTAWVGSDDGILVYDQNSDGIANDGSEIVFTGLHPDATTDLEGLALALDDNDDGFLTAEDAAYAKMGVWRDRNNNGRTDAGEFATLAAMGIASLTLTSDGQAYSAANGDVQVHGEAAFTYNDGTTGTLADASFAVGNSVANAPDDGTQAAEDGDPAAAVTAALAASVVDELEASEDAEEQSSVALLAPEDEDQPEVDRTDSDGQTSQTDAPQPQAAEADPEAVMGAALAQLDAQQNAGGAPDAQSSDTAQDGVMIDQTALGDASAVADFVVGDGAIDLNDLFETAETTSSAGARAAWAPQPDTSPVPSNTVEVTASILYHPDHDGDQQQG